MRETELKMLFPTEKLEALRFFMAKKELSIEQELQDYLDKTYEKVVPANVREYVESRLGLELAQEPAPEPEMQERQPDETPEPEAPEQQPEQQRVRQPRQSRRQREQAAAEAAPVLDSPGWDAAPDEEESQGMSMSM
ncbi:Uncharacterized [Syntrophomonas zehnderi OL-4]|uniref:Uncharacterized n=1 Tax=Syntrophomonas zehnderi OL-4 TaxID=690567 RepID=A0A0E4GCV1_9FIRM|nr:DUF6103 family protein [Syntrophomonas zehnderi]CFX91615.1 Uncharacterized [Syntrophomonas zehnderi OL-4]